VQQTMLAIVRLNPQAFIDGNINLLKAGYVLRLPDEGEAKSLERDAALAAVAEHNQAWQAYRNGGSAAVAETSSSAAAAPMAAQVDATRQPARSAAHGTGSDGELRIVAGDSTRAGGAATGTGGKDDEAVQAQLAANSEEIERVSRERDEAVANATRAEAEKQEAQRQIEVKSQQLAEVQQQLKDANAKKASEPAAPAHPAQSKSSLLAMLSSPLVLGGVGLVVVLLVVAALASMRRRRAASLNAEVPLFESRTRRTPARAAAAVEELEQAEPDEEEAPAAVEQGAVAASEHEEHHETHEGAQTSDVIGEADIYIAYGRYPQAVNLLLGALEEDAARSDVRLKLLEVYADTRDADAFAHQMQLLQQHCEDNEMLLEARELEAKLREAEPSAAPPAPVAAAVAAMTPSEEFDLDLDDDAVARPPAPQPTRSKGSDDLGGDLGIDFDPDVQTRNPMLARVHGKAQRAQAAEQNDVALEDGEPEFDLEDLELDDGRAAAPAHERKVVDENADDAFDFLDEEDTASTKLDLARAYIDMGDDDGAREILTEVVQEGSAEQRKQADELLAKLT
jgi:pilus assembly protein FimV